MIYYITCLEIPYSLKKTLPSDNLFSEAESDGIHPAYGAWEVEGKCRGYWRIWAGYGEGMGSQFVLQAI